MSNWKPDEIIINDAVRDDPVTIRVVEQCPGVPVRYVSSSKPSEVVAASTVLSAAGPDMINTILAGKRVLHVAPPGDAVDVFTMPDDRMVCPHFERLKLASNGCFYRCDWCYLKLTYRVAYPFITVRAGLDIIKDQLGKRLSKASGPVMFNSGELADSLSMEHLTGAARERIPWFSRSGNGYLFMLTKSDNVDGILDLEHNGHTIVVWSINAPEVSGRFELGAPSFDRRLAAAAKVQKAGYPARIRLDPIVPVPGWREQYAETIRRIFEEVNPERVTLGTLRFEPGFYKNRRKLVTTGNELLGYMERMEPMFPPLAVPGKKNPVEGKHSFPDDERAELFKFAIAEIRKFSDCRIALCKESAAVWERVGLPLYRCSCVCQLDYADMGSTVKMG